MKKRNNFNINLNFSNRALYTFISFFAVLAIAAGVYAYGTSNPSAFGHSYSELQVCAEGQILKVSGGAWTCSTDSGAVWTSSGGVATYNGVAKASYFQDLDNTGFYVDPSSVSYLNDIRPSIIYDRDNTAYYVNPNSNSVFNAIYANAYYYNSDKRLKENIKNLNGNDALNGIEQLNGVTFNWKDNGDKSLGLLAQDVEKVYPELVHENPQTGYKSVEYSNLVAVLIEAVKEQQKQIDELKKELNKQNE